MRYIFTIESAVYRLGKGHPSLTYRISDKHLTLDSSSQSIDFLCTFFNRNAFSYCCAI